MSVRKEHIQTKEDFECVSPPTHEYITLSIAVQLIIIDNHLYFLSTVYKFIY